MTATMALVLALGGTSYAVSKLPANSVGEAQLRRGAVSAGKIRDGAVGRAKLAPDAAIAGPRGPRGPEGPGGTQGPRGPSEAFISRNNAGVSVPSGTSVLVAELNLAPGAYALDFAAHTYLNAGTTFVDCQVHANGAMLAKTAVMVGPDPPGTVEAVVAMNEAGTWTTDVRVRVYCSERAETSAQMTDARLRAIRVGSVAVQ